ncbi:glyoxalase/bleomycin resistance protein/dioxygenase family protein (plasmid) [Rhizobium etli 8C-3]|uniref:Glyoxalase/bleomycin resistance protein/dioxygenase family protein n=1 Tax=Rhizobium etli 8C-3 TaxID=538025 RepID=A0A1L5PHA6_RHIET|nr:VOC family protein [Rhizobium etli]APO79571.1 glyoxalase/bleomycin resistance protein/dioxygenase family protein [Rhizobium etli 8C-3]
MHIIGIDHIQLAMPSGEEEDARAFYQGLLGLREVSKPAHLAARGGCWFEGEGAKIHLGVEAEFVPARKAHPGLLVRDLSRLSERLEDAGFPTITDQPLDGYNRRYVSDPFGNRLELMERC